MRHSITCIAVLFWAATAQHPEKVDLKAADVLARATAGMRGIATEGGYLWRYSEDLEQRWGEVQATATQIWVQPPGTPSMGMAFLRAYRATKDPRHLAAAAQAAAALARGQLESGGWDYLIDFDPEAGRQAYRRTDKGYIPEKDAAGRQNTTTFDDDNTQSALRFLMAFVAATPDRGEAPAGQSRAALDYGLAKMLAAQYPNGAWPQRWSGRPHDADRHPVKPASIPRNWPRMYSKEDYTGHYTLNDNTQRDCILTMLAAWRQLGKAEYLNAAKKGGDFLILAQLPAPQPVWAQQYNPGMEPAWARAFEPPAACAAESAGVIRSLVDLYLETDEEKYLAPIPRAIEWYRRSQIRPNIWARFYELSTNRRIYGDRDGRIHYRLGEISEERRKGYSWEADFGIQAAIDYFEQVAKAGGRKAYLAQPVRHSPARPPESEIKRIAASLNGRGLWVSNGRIETSVFIQNVERLCEYLEGFEKEGRR